VPKKPDPSWVSVFFAEPEKWTHQTGTRVGLVERKADIPQIEAVMELVASPKSWRGYLEVACWPEVGLAGSQSEERG